MELCLSVVELVELDVIFFVEVVVGSCYSEEGMCLVNF